MFFPKKIKFKKSFKHLKNQKVNLENKIQYGDFAIKSLESGRITSKQLESTKKMIVKKMKKIGFVWLRVFPNNPVTNKPNENRMGKGKGSFSFWSTNVKEGQIVFEITGISFENAKQILKDSSKKLPLKMKFIFK
jgi:large subunit ribosomal protein L16